MASPAAPKGGAVKRQQKEAAPYSDSSGEELMPPVPVPRKQAARKDASAEERLAPMEPVGPEEGTVLPPLPKKSTGSQQKTEEEPAAEQEALEGEEQPEAQPEDEIPVPRKAPARQQIEEEGPEAPPAPKRQAKPLTFSAAEQRVQSNMAVMKKMQTAAAKAGIPVQTNPVQTSRSSGHAQTQESDRVPSGIPGLDELLGGGFEKTSTIIVIGDPGCGKTTFLSQFLYNGAAQYGDPGVLLSFEEQRDSILRHMKGYGFDFTALEKQGMFATISYRPHEVKKLIDEGGGLILDTISSIGAKRLAIDSLTSYSVLFESAYQMREAELLLFEFLSKWKCTTMMSAEGVKALRRKTSVGTASLADGVIMLHHPRHKALRYRALEVLKMRGTRQSEKLCPFEFVEDVGIKVYPNEEIFYKIREKEA